MAQNKQTKRVKLQKTIQRLKKELTEKSLLLNESNVLYNALKVELKEAVQKNRIQNIELKNVLGSK